MLISSIHATPKLPIAYDIWAELMRRVDDGGVTMQDVGKIVSRDASLVAKILSLANSAYFSLKEHVSSIEDALLRIGTVEIMKLVAFLSFRETTKGGLPIYGITQKEYMELSVATGLFMGHFSGNCGLTVTEGYTLGLLRGIGHWLIQGKAQSINTLNYFTGPYMQVATWETQAVNGTHVDYSVELIERINMPKNMVDIVRHYLNPFKAANTKAASYLHISTFESTNIALAGRGSFELMHLPVSIPEEEMEEIRCVVREELKVVMENSPTS